MPSPLAGLNIAVTRPRDQAGQLAQGIENAGGKAILFPLLEIAPATDPERLRELVARLPNFDLAIFISPNAVRHGMAAIRAAGIPPAGIKAAAVGQGSASALRDEGVQNVIAPAKGSDSEALLALPELQKVQGNSIMIFRGDGGRELLGDTLRARGATVEYAECYRRLKAQQDGASLLAARPDAITVTSSEALAHLWDMFDDNGKQRLAALPLFVPHARIAAAARQFGWEKVSVTTSGDDGMLQGLIAWAELRTQDSGFGIQDL